MQHTSSVGTEPGRRGGAKPCHVSCDSGTVTSVAASDSSSDDGGGGGWDTLLSIVPEMRKFCIYMYILTFNSIKPSTF